MHPYLKQKLPELETFCRRHGVARLAVFGSATRESFDPRISDYGFLVEFLPLPACRHDHPPRIIPVSPGWKSPVFDGRLA